MKFPGKNEITLTESAIRELLKTQAPALFGDEEARITEITTRSYPAGLVVTFTTDPDPADAPAVPRRRAASDAVEAPPCTPLLVEDDNPF